MASKIRLGSLDLPEGIVTRGDGLKPGALAVSVRTLGLKTIWWESRIVSGQEIDLVALEDQGWLTAGQVQTLQAMASEPGAIYTLVVGDRGTWRVRFRNEDPPSLDLEPVLPEGPDWDDVPFWRGTIKLITV
jgi:hypothetical protein